MSKYTFRKICVLVSIGAMLISGQAFAGKFVLNVDGVKKTVLADTIKVHMLGIGTVQVNDDYADTSSTTINLPGGGTKTITTTPNQTIVTTHDPAAGDGTTRTTTQITDKDGNETTMTTTCDQNKNCDTVITSNNPN